MDLFRLESLILRTHWVMLVMDHYTRRIVGFIAGRSSPRLSLLKNRIFRLRPLFACSGNEGRRPSRVRQFDPDDRLTEPVCGQETPFNYLNI